MCNYIAVWGNKYLPVAGPYLHFNLVQEKDDFTVSYVCSDNNITHCTIYPSPAGVLLWSFYNYYGKCNNCNLILSNLPLLRQIELYLLYVRQKVPRLMLQLQKMRF